MEKVLVVEDDPISHAIMVKAIQALGYSCHGCDNGVKALKILNQNPDIKILVTDIVMQEMDGRELIRQVRNDERFLTLPILIVSGIISRSELSAELDLGFADYLPKPIDIKQLQVKIDTLAQSSWSLNSI